MPSAHFGIVMEFLGTVIIILPSLNYAQLLVLGCSRPKSASASAGCGAIWLNTRHALSVRLGKHPKVPVIRRIKAALMNGVVNPPYLVVGDDGG